MKFYKNKIIKLKAIKYNNKITKLINIYKKLEYFYNQFIKTKI